MEHPLDRHVPDIITELNEGDILDVDGCKYRIIKPGLGWIRHRAWLKFDDFAGTSLVPAENVWENFVGSKPGDSFVYASNGMAGTYLGEVQYREARVRVVDASMVGVPKKKDIMYLYLTLFLSGDPEAYDELFSSSNNCFVNMSKVNVTKARVAREQSYDFTKWELIPYVVEVNGPMSREEILQQVQRLQGRPYVPGSNRSYFMDGDARRAKPGAISRGLLKVDHKKGNTLVYGVGDEGKKKAQDVINQIGAQPGIKV